MDYLSIPASLNPKQITEKAIKLGKQKIHKDYLSIILSGILAGAYISFAGALAQVVSFDVGKISDGLARFLAGSVFSSGLIYVMIAGGDLFTGNVMTGITASMNKDVTVYEYVKNLIMIYFANFIGSLIVVAIVFYGGLWKYADLALGAKMLNIAAYKCSLPFLETFMRGIGANWLVCLGVWLAIATGDTAGKIFACYVPVMAFVALGFEHSIANMYSIPLGLFLKCNEALTGFISPDKLANITWKNFLITNEVPATLGNIVGGAFFVGMFYFWIYIRKRQDI